MEKRTYIQPAMDTMVLPKDALMGEDLILSSSGEGPNVGAPARHDSGPKDVMF